MLTASELLQTVIFCRFLGIAIDKDGVVYFADGANIRTIDSAGIIRTVIGSLGHPKYFQPLPCYKVIPAANVCNC